MRQHTNALHSFLIFFTLNIKFIARIILHELQISYRFVWRDLSATVIPNLILTIAALKVKNQLYPSIIIAALIRSLVYFWLYIYAFCLANQLVGIQEDSMNKPDRPLSSGLVTPQGTQLRWWIVTLTFLCVGWYFGILKWALLWQLCIVLHNHHGWSRHWFPKNMIIMPVGLIALMCPAWELVTPLTPLMWRWVIVLAVVVGVTINLQDLRDMDGDRLIGRRTLPLSWGEDIARLFLSISFILLAVVIHFYLMMPAGNSLRVRLCDIFLAIMSLVISVRIIVSKSSRMDHKTYMLYTYWYCCVMASAIVVL